MFKYASDVSNIAHYIIRNFCENRDVAVDATLGNGHDTDFLKDNFRKVHAFDIQEAAVEKYRKKNASNVTVINDSHEHIKEHVHEKVGCVMMNLGFLPGGDKKVTTRRESTIQCMEASLELLDSGGFMTIAVYTGHEEGKKESQEVLDFARNLPKNEYGVILHRFENRKNNPPYLIVIEKK